MSSRGKTIIFLGSQDHGSGAERVLEYLLHGAVERRDAICLLSPQSSSVTQVARSLGYEWIPWRSRKDALPNNAQAFERFLREFGKFPPGDVIHAWHTRHLEWAFLLGRRWNIASAGTLHDDPDPAHHQFGRVRKIIIRQSAFRLDGVVSVSEAVVQRCRELGWTREMVTIRNGLPDTPPVPRTPSDALRLGFMATGVLWKGLSLLPELIRRTSDLSLEWNLFGFLSPETEPLMKEISSLPRVHYGGRVPLQTALASIDVLLHLSQALDPYPTVLLEAARGAIPAVATRTGGSPEIVADGSTGILIKPGDQDDLERAIRCLHSSPDLRKKMATSARDRFERDFRVERMVADYFAFWNRLRLVRP